MGVAKGLSPIITSSNKLSQLFNCLTNVHFLCLNTLSLNYTSDNHEAPNEAVIICQSVDKETKHKEHFQEFGSNLNGIFHHLVGLISNLSQMLIKHLQFILTSIQI